MIELGCESRAAAALCCVPSGGSGVLELRTPQKMPIGLSTPGLASEGGVKNWMVWANTSAV
ncbi:hypothetical protein D3C72_929230 [compost metagenome]